MPTHKYKYPEEFLTKKGTLKKNLNKKKLTEWRNTHNYDGTLISSQKSSSSSEDISDSAFRKMHSPLEKHEQKDYLVDKNTTRKHKNKKSLKKTHSSSSSSSLEALKKEFLDGIEDSIEDLNDRAITYSDLSMDIHEKILDEYVFDNNGRILTHESCKKMRDYCELNPRKCYLEKEFLERYVRICQMIAKTGLYVDAFYDRTIDLNLTYLRRGPSNSQSWRNDRYGTLAKLDIVIREKIPKTQMPIDAKEILISVIGNIPRLSGGIKIIHKDTYYRRESDKVRVFKNTLSKFVGELAKDEKLMELMISAWRERMAILTDRKPKQIEEIIRRFIKNL
tara:strand:+ start:6160 stop:7167 length:1008 start_codon:yes stop_codon:yes gene_type:complete